MKSRVRQPARAGQFYEASQEDLQRAVTECAGDFAPPGDLGEMVGGIVPHAGWMFSGPTAAKVFLCLSKGNFETIVLLGAVHAWPGRQAGVYPEGAWATPLGQASVDDELASFFIKQGGDDVIASIQAHDYEHSIEVQVPFIQSLMPKAKILPVAVPHVANAIQIGEALAEAIQAAGRRAAVVASTDLTHYGMGYGGPSKGLMAKAMPWMRANDRRIIDLMQELRADEIIPEAEENENSCGPGAAAAAIAAARKLGATKARLLEYTTSADVYPEPDADRAVGYAGLVFEKPRS